MKYSVFMTKNIILLISTLVAVFVNAQTTRLRILSKASRQPLQEVVVSYGTQSAQGLDKHSVSNAQGIAELQVPKAFASIMKCPHWAIPLSAGKWWRITKPT